MNLRCSLALMVGMSHTLTGSACLFYDGKFELLKLQFLGKEPFNFFPFISDAAQSGDLFLQLFHLVAQLLDNCTAATSCKTIWPNLGELSQALPTV